MIKVKTPDQKRALAAALRKYDNGYLSDMLMFADSFGPSAAATYENDDPARQTAIVAEYEAMLAAESDKSRAKVLAELAKAKEATK